MPEESVVKRIEYASVCFKICKCLVIILTPRTSLTSLQSCAYVCPRPALFLRGMPCMPRPARGHNGSAPTAEPWVECIESVQALVQYRKCISLLALFAHHHNILRPAILVRIFDVYPLALPCFCFLDKLLPHVVVLAAYDLPILHGDRGGFHSPISGSASGGRRRLPNPGRPTARPRRRSA